MVVVAVAVVEVVVVVIGEGVGLTRLREVRRESCATCDSPASVISRHSERLRELSRWSPVRRA